MSAAFRLLGIDDDVTVCELCGKRDLKCTMALQPLDVDGSPLGEVVRYGRDCGARVFGWRVSSDRAERLLRGEARVSDRWVDDELRRRDIALLYAGPVEAELDGVRLELLWTWYAHRVPVGPGTGWTETGKGTRRFWRVARGTVSS